MGRTKWMRLLVRDPADILRWAGSQRARHLSEFRYRVIGGRECVSFRMVPGYSIQIGTSDIVVVAHVVRSGLWRRVAGAVRAAYAGAVSAAMRSLPVRPTPMNSTISAAATRISPDNLKASR